MLAIAGGDAVDSDAMGCPLRGQPFCEVRHRSLGRVVEHLRKRFGQPSHMSTLRTMNLSQRLVLGGLVDDLRGHARGDDDGSALRVVVDPQSLLLFQ